MIKVVPWLYGYFYLFCDEFHKAVCSSSVSMLFINNFLIVLKFVLINFSAFSVDMKWNVMYYFSRAPLDGIYVQE